MADASTSIGKVHLEVEVDPVLSDGDSKKQLQRIAEAVQKGLAGLKNSFKLTGLDKAFEECFKSMNQTMAEQMNIMKESMKMFITEIKEMLKSAKFTFSKVQFIQGKNDDNEPSQESGTRQSPRAPPGVSFKMPKINYGTDLQMELLQQQASELEQLMDNLDNKVLSLQSHRKELLGQYRLSMSVGAEKALGAEVMQLDQQIAKVQNQAIRTNISLKALDQQLASMSGTDSAETKMSSLSQSMAGIGGKALSTGSMFSSMMPKLSAVLNVVKRLGPVFRQGAKSIGKLSAALLGINTSSKKASGGMNGAQFSLGRLIKSFVVFSLIFPLVSQGIRSLGKAISSTLMTNEAFKTSLDQIKSNLMAAFMPIYQAILPALNSLMSALANVTAHFAALISALFGTTYSASINAAKGMVDAKNAMGAYGSAAKKAAKDANSSVMAFDKLNKLNGKDDDGNDKMPNIIPTDIDTSVASGWADKIKQMFKDQDYDGIGQMIGEGINKGVAKVTQFIDWSNVGGKITSVVDGFSCIFNSTIATIDWQATGAMVGTGVNTIANTIKLFFESINWTGIGQALGNGLNGLVHKVDWANLGQTWGSYLRARINGFLGFVQTADWPGIGKSLADGVMGLANYVDWGKFGTLVGSSISGIMSTIHNFVTNIDWRGLGSKIASTLNNFWKSMNWADYGMTLSDAARGLLNTLRKALADIDFMQLGIDLANFLSNIDWLGLLIDVGVVIGRAFLGLGATIMSGVTQLASNLVAGFLNGIIEFFGDIPGWIKNHIVDPFINAIKDLFGIHSPSTVLAEIGGNLIQGLINGIANLIPNLIGNIASWFGGIGTKISETWESVKTGAKSAWESVKTTVTGKCSEIKSSISTAMDNIGTKMSGIAEKAVTWGSDMMSGMASGIKSASSWVTNAVSGVASKITSWLHFSRPDVGPLREYEKWMPDMVQGLASTLESKSPMLVASVRNMAQNVSSALQGISQPSLAFAGSTSAADQYSGNTPRGATNDDIVRLLSDIVSLLQINASGGSSTSEQEIVIKWGDTEIARLVIAAIRKYEKETGRKVLVS